MGIEQHHAIIVQGGDWGDSLGRAHIIAETIFKDTVSPVIKSPMNGWLSFYIAPDGSKDGWEQSDIGDERRAQFIKAMDGMKVTVIEVTWGELRTEIREIDCP